MVQSSQVSPSPADEPLRFERLSVFVRGLEVEAGIGVYDHEHGRLQRLVIAVEALREPREYPAHISLTAGGAPLLFEGRRVTRADDIGDNYVYIGDVALSPDDPVATILDPGLPGWISARASVCRA